jgi:hypothetical protein
VLDDVTSGVASKVLDIDLVHSTVSFGGDFTLDRVTDGGASTTHARIALTGLTALSLTLTFALAFTFALAVTTWLVETGVLTAHPTFATGLTFAIPVLITLTTGLLTTGLVSAVLITLIVAARVTVLLVTLVALILLVLTALLLVLLFLLALLAVVVLVLVLLVFFLLLLDELAEVDLEGLVRIELVAFRPRVDSGVLVLKDRATPVNVRGLVLTRNQTLIDLHVASDVHVLGVLRVRGDHVRATEVVKVEV